MVHVESDHPNGSDSSDAAAVAADARTRAFNGGFGLDLGV